MNPEQKPKVIFVVPLQGRQASRDWSRIVKLVKRTLDSACGQTEPATQVVLVHNEDSDPGFEHPRLLRVPVSLPVPGKLSSERMADKWAKLRHGLDRVRSMLPAHIMFVDADDCVHRGLAAYIATHDPGSSWIMERGYLYEEGSRWLIIRKKFHLFCGTSSVVWTTPEEVPDNVLAPTAPCFLLDHGHTVIARALRERGTPVRELPFPGVVYNTGTGENDSGISIRNWKSKKQLLELLLGARFLTRKLKRDFHL